MNDLDRLLKDVYRSAPVPEAVAFEAAVARKRRLRASDRVRWIMRVYWALAAVAIAVVLHATRVESTMWWVVCAIVLLSVVHPAKIIQHTLKASGLR